MDLGRKGSERLSEEIKRAVERKKERKNVSWYGGGQRARKIWRNIGQ